MSERRRALAILATRDGPPHLSAPFDSRMMYTLFRVGLRLSNRKIENEAIDSPQFPLRGWFDVDSIFLEHATDEELSLLASFPECRRLHLRYGQFSDQGLIHLQVMRNLRELEIWCDDITDQGLANLRGLDHLEKFEIQFAQIQGAGFREMTCQESLQELSICFSEVFDDAGMLELAAFRNLKRLDVGDCRVQGPGLAVVDKLPHLRFLYGVRATKVDPQWAPYIKRVPNRY